MTCRLNTAFLEQRGDYAKLGIISPLLGDSLYPANNVSAHS
jgi:hypothetical protein